GVRHEDAFGPIGYGLHDPPGRGAYKPTYPGPVGAFETFDHLITSPDTVGTDRFNDTANDLFFGEREAVKLAFSESGTVVNEQAAAHNTGSAAQPIGLAALAVPNTLVRGLHAAAHFDVAAVDVTGAIGLDPATGKSESDFYSFDGRAGDLLNLSVFSTGLTRLPDLG